LLLLIGCFFRLALVIVFVVVGILVVA
jgi:hypothetical protein